MRKKGDLVKESNLSFPPVQPAQLQVQIALLVLAALFGALTPAHSKVVTYGTGLKSCGAYLEAKEQQGADEVAFIDWLSGYVSGVNALSNRINNILGDTNLQRTVLWLGTFCQRHPQTLVAVALDVLVVNSRSTVARPTVEVVTYGAGFRPCSLYLEARRERSPDEAAFMDWLSGYVSAVNAFSLSTDSVLGNSDITDAIQWVDDYCEAHSDVHFATAAEARILGGSRPVTLNRPSP
jgi:hypothetical protein